MSFVHHTTDAVQSSALGHLVSTHRAAYREACSREADAAVLKEYVAFPSFWRVRRLRSHS